MQKDNRQTDYRQDLKKRILKASMVEFCRKGVRSVKMDDIAANLAISKRTLYEIYANKEELLLAGIKQSEEDYDNHMEEFIANPIHDVIDVIVEFYNMQIQHVSDINPLLFNEIDKYERVRDFLEFRHTERSKDAVSFFKRGMDEGYFRRDIDYNIVSRVSNSCIDYIMREQMYKEYDLKHILHNMIFLFVRGICTEAGSRKLDKFVGSGV